MGNQQSQTADDAVIQAAHEYRQLRDRLTNPSGTFDRAGRFYLQQTAACCLGIRYLSRRWPYPQMMHGRSAGHIATLYGVNRAELLRAARRLDKQM